MENGKREKTMRSAEVSALLGKARAAAADLIAELLKDLPGGCMEFPEGDAPDFVDIDNGHALVRVERVYLEDGAMPVADGSDGCERTIYEGFSTDDMASLAEAIERRMPAPAPAPAPRRPGGLWMVEHGGRKYGCSVSLDMASGAVSMSYFSDEGREIGSVETPCSEWTGGSPAEGLARLLREHGRAMRLGIERCEIEHGLVRYPAFLCLDKGGLILLVAPEALRSALGNLDDPSNLEGRLADEGIFGYVPMDWDSSDNDLVDMLEAAWGSDGIFDFAPEGAFD